ncbi:MAG: hypothetical protein FWC83_01685 [Alphaproteobacteria bacterium]|nr:hypothetical protein [Alphaproteobacteria bacterium]
MMKRIAGFFTVLFFAAFVSISSYACPAVPGTSHTPNNPPTCSVGSGVTLTSAHGTFRFQTNCNACSGGTPHWHTGQNGCRQCTTNAHCPGAQTCNASGNCITPCIPSCLGGCCDFGQSDGCGGFCHGLSCNTGLSCNHSTCMCESDGPCIEEPCCFTGHCVCRCENNWCQGVDEHFCPGMGCVPWWISCL